MTLLLDHPATRRRGRTLGRVAPAPVDPDQPVLPGFGTEPEAPAPSPRPEPKAAPELRRTATTPELRQTATTPELRATTPEAPVTEPSDPHAPEPALDPVPADRPPRTLDDLLSSTWNTLSAGTTASCPLCGGELTPRWSAGAGVVGGRCHDCGTELS